MWWSVIFGLIKKFWTIIVIAILLFFLYYAYTQYTAMKDRATRFEYNYASRFFRHNTQNNEVLTKDEFNRYYSNLLDSINLKINKKLLAKNIQNITHVHNYYIDSSTVVYHSTELTKGLFEISYSDNCCGFNGAFNLSDTTVNIYKKWFNNDLHIIDYWQRQPLFGVKILPNWGKKAFFRETMSNCNKDSVVVEKIIITEKNNEI